MYVSAFDEKWHDYFNNSHKDIKERIAKKIKKILAYPQKKHMSGKAKYFVDEVGQHRIVYRVFEENKEVRFYVSI